jgi:hypothetical protein
MSKIVVDDELRRRLNGLPPATELCDPAGQTLGYLLSPEEYLKLRYAWEKQEAVDLAELERIAQEPEEWTLEEIWKELGQK